MSVQEIKLKIQQELDKVPEERLNEVLSYLQKVQNNPGSEFTFNQHLEKILTEDRELLKKLAQ